MQRTRRVAPDYIYETRDGQQILAVSDEALAEAVLAAVQVVQWSGGGFLVLTQRARTGVPNEMVTVEAFIEWKDRTDAKPQPEQSVQPKAAPDPTPEELEEQLEIDASEDPEERLLREAEAGEDTSAMERTAA